MKRIVLIVLLALMLVGCKGSLANPDVEFDSEGIIIPNIQLITDFEIIYSAPYHKTIYRFIDFEYNNVCYSFSDGISCVSLGE